MSNDTTKAGSGVDTPEQGGEKTFTQDQLNAIVSKRLAEEKGKFEAEVAQKEQDIQRREFMLSAKETLKEKGLPETLLRALDISTPGAFKEAVEIVEGIIKPAQEQNEREAKKPRFTVPANLGGYDAPPRDTVIKEAFGLRKK